MRVLLVLALVATTKSAPQVPNLPLGYQYQNVKSTPCGSSPLNIKRDIISTPVPTDLKNAFVTSTPSPLGFENELVSSTLDGNAFGPIISTTPQIPIFSSTPNADGVSSEYFSSTPAPSLLNQNFNSFFLPNIQTNPLGLSQFSYGNSPLINLESNSLSNSLTQSIPSRFGDFNSVTIQSTTSGGSLNDAFGISEDVIETQSQRPEVAKNVYYFAAPEEPEPIRPRVIFEQNKKNVNLIFIKAPAAPSLGTIEITPPRQESAEKTAVYVLVKKPEEQQNILVKSAPVVKPNKPDVVFIKYKNEQEAQHYISQVQARHDIEDIANHQLGQELSQSDELFNIENAKLSLQSKPIAELISNGAFLQQTVTPPSFSSSTESTFSTLGNGITTQVSPFQVPVKSFSNLGYSYGINNVPLIYSTPRPQVEINSISNNDNLDNFITIGGRPLSTEIISSTVSPFIESSSVSPFASSTELPFSVSTTVRPSISGLNPFYKKK